jgi:hypothetical protein
MIGIGAGLLVVVIIAVVALSVLVCRHRCHVRSDKSDVSSSRSGSSIGSGSDLVMVSNRYKKRGAAKKQTMNVIADDFSPSGLPSARKATLFWKGNRTAMNGK